MINVFLRVYFDVFRQNSRFKFRSSHQSLFYVFEVFVDSGARRGPLINIFLRVYFDVFRQTSHLNLRSSKLNLFYVFGVFVDSRGRGDQLINVFLRVYFDRQSSRYKFCSSDQSLFNVFEFL